MKNSSRVLVNTFTQAASRFLVILASLLTTALLTRLLGVDGYGDYVFITSFVLIFIGLSDMGTTTIGVREASVAKENSSEIFSQVLSLRTVFSLILFGVINLLIIFLPQFEGLRFSTFIASSVIIFLILRTTVQSILQTFLRLDLSSLLEIYAAIIFLIPIIFLNVLGRSLSLNYLMFFWAFSALVSGFLGLLLSCRFAKLKFSFDRQKLSQIMIEAFPLGIYLLVYSVYDRGIDSFIIKTLAGSSAVGFYGLAYKIHGNLILGAAFLMNSLFPLLSSYKSDFELLKKTYEKAFTVLFLTAVIILLLGLVAAPFVIQIIAGENFAPSVWALRILLGATFFSYLNHLSGYLLVVLGEQKKLLTFSVFALFLNLILNIILIPLFSFYAAAAVTVVTEMVVLLLTLGFLNKRYQLEYSLKTFQNNILVLFSEKHKYFDKL
jgi:O-antigen/teichoic acid export membrane protein